jgi:hypothetical protein
MDSDLLRAPYPTKERSVQIAEQAYRSSLAAALSAESESAITPWFIDKFDRIY